MAARFTGPQDIFDRRNLCPTILVATTVLQSQLHTASRSMPPVPYARQVATPSMRLWLQPLR
nr:hypothetical protein JVH1_8334 [Rhodococcus sp. JVH1]